MHAGHVSSPGFRNIQNVVRRVKSGRSPYHLVECMACPGGCANGGGQPRPPPLEATDRAARVERLMSDADETRLRAPADNPAVRALYARLSDTQAVHVQYVQLHDEAFLDLLDLPRFSCLFSQASSFCW